MPNIKDALDFAGIRYYLSVAGNSLMPDDAASRADLERVRRLASKAFHFKGSVPNYESLPKTGNKTGDVWNIGGTLDGENVAWTGSAWDSMGTFAPLAGLVPAEKAPPLESADDYSRLAVSPAIANYAKRLQVDDKLDTGADGKEIALLNAAVTMCAKSMNGLPLVMCSGASYANSATFYIPTESVTAGVPIPVHIVGRPVVLWVDPYNSNRTYKIWSDEVRLSIADPSAASFTPPAIDPEDNRAIGSFSGLQLVNEKTGEAFGSVGGTYRKVNGRPMYSLSLSWTGGELFIWAGRGDGGPMGVNFTSLRPGAPKTIAVDAADKDGKAPHAGLNAYFFPTAGVDGFISASAAPEKPLSNGLAANLGSRTDFPDKGSCKWFYDIPVDEKWKDEAQHDCAGRLSATWALVDGVRGFASLSWAMKGMFAEQPMTLSVRFKNPTPVPAPGQEEVEPEPDPVLAEETFQIHPYVPSIVSFSTAMDMDGDGENDLDLSEGENFYLEMAAAAAEDGGTAELNPKATGVSVAKAETALATDDAFIFNAGLIPRVDGEDVPVNDGGTFSVRWMRLNEVLDGNSVVIGHDYACAVVWMPPVPHAWRVLQNRTVKDKIDELCGEDDVATHESNGAVSWTDKRKLDGIVGGANYTITPDPVTGVRRVRVDSALDASSANPVQTVAIFNALKTKITREAEAVPSVEGAGGSAGTLPALDKAKLDGLDANAAHTELGDLPQGDASTMGIVKVDASVKESSVNPVRNNAVYSALKQKISRDDVAVPSVGGSNGSAGTLPAADKEKLDKLDPDAGHTTIESLPVGDALTMGVVMVDSAASSTSDNPVQTIVATSETLALRNYAAGIGASIDGTGLVTRGTSQVVSGTKTFESAVIGNAAAGYKGAVLSGGTAVYASSARFVSSAGFAGEFFSGRDIVLQGALSGSAAFVSNPVAISASLSGGVPPAASSEGDLVLMAGSSGALKWGLPGFDTYLAKIGDQTVATEKDFKGDGSADNGMLVADPVRVSSAEEPEDDASSAEEPEDGVLGVYPGQAVSWSFANYYYVKDMLRREVEHRTDGKNTIIRGADGSIHVMVVIKKFDCSIFPPEWGLGSGTHPAFIVGDREVPEILIGKYLASVPAVLGAGPAVPEKFKTLRGKVPFGPFVSPYGSNGIISNIAKTAGKGFQLNTIFNWGAAALLGLKAREQYKWQVVPSGTSPTEPPYSYRGEVASVDALPSSGASPYDSYKIEGSDPAVYYAYVLNADFPGNLYYGQCLVDADGRPVADQTSGTGTKQTGTRFDLTYPVPGTLGPEADPAILTGTGPNAWTHDGTLYGICDMVGNRAELVIGMGSQNGTPTGAIRVAANNAAMKDGANAAEPSTVLYADGSVVAGAGSSNAVYWNYSGGVYTLTKTAPGSYTAAKTSFSGIQSDASVSGAVQFLRRLGLFPVHGLVGGGEAYIAKGTTQAVAMFMGGCGNPSSRLCRGGLFSVSFTNSTTDGSVNARGIRLAYLP